MNEANRERHEAADEIDRLRSRFAYAAGLSVALKIALDDAGVPVIPSPELDVRVKVLVEERDRLRAALAEAKRDGERVEWFFGFEPAKSPNFLLTYMRGMAERWSVDQWHAAIDAAMEGEK